jgi:hypothetical protein
MLKPSIKNIILYLLVKYVIFFIFLALVNNRFKSLVIDNSVNEHDLVVNTFYYVLYVLIFIFFLVLIFLFPLYFAFKLKHPLYFILLIIAFLSVEFFVYTYSASQKNLVNGIFNAILSLIFLFIFFFKEIKARVVMR